MNWSNIKFYVVEDEQANREAFVELLSEGSDTSVIGSAASVGHAFQDLLFKEPDALLLDVNLQDGNAFQLLDKLKKNNLTIPPTVIITGYLKFQIPQEAVNHYRDEIVYILEKPFLENWKSKYQAFCDAIRVAQARKSSNNTNGAVHFFRSGSETYRVVIEDLEYIEVGGQGSVVIYTIDGKQIRIYQTLSKLLPELPDKIVRIHRRFAIHRDKVSHINHEDRMLYLNGVKQGLDIGDSYYGKILEILE